MKTDVVKTTCDMCFKVTYDSKEKPANAPAETRRKVQVFEGEASSTFCDVCEECFDGITSFIDSAASG